MCTIFQWATHFPLAPSRCYISQFVWDTWEPRRKRAGSERMVAVSELPQGGIPPAERAGFCFVGRFIENKGLSDWICDLFVSWPILASVDAYRRNHLAHHRYTNTEQDPDWVVKLGTRKFTFPQEWQYAVLNLLGYLAFIGSAFDMIQAIQRLRAHDQSTRAYKLTRLAYYLAFAIVFTLTGAWVPFLLYWVVPFMTVFFLALYVRSVAEHFAAMNYAEELQSTRTVLPYVWENLVFSPHGVNYHLEHHLYPSVPFYNLPRLHDALMADPDYAARAHITRGYTTGLVRECLAPALVRSPG